ncbi:50S ribosomal protein L33 [Pontibacillus litoralis]|nr:50S ribosomal protein L33 [Pontibacillus litoralis]
MNNKIILACAECMNRNYSTDRSAGSEQRLEVRKYCKYCNKHTMHRETK